MVRRMFLSGVGTRRVQDVIEALLGEGVSAQTVSRICRSVDADVQGFHSRPPADCYQYLTLDGIVLGFNGSASVKRRLVLCAYGIRYDGLRELVDFRQSESASAAQWLAFINVLYERGMRGVNVINVKDGHSGLHYGLDAAYPCISRRPGWVHKLRNMAAKLPRRIQEPCLARTRTLDKPQR